MRGNRASGERGAIAPLASAPNSNNPFKLLEASWKKLRRGKKNLLTHFLVLSRLKMTHYRLTNTLLTKTKHEA